MKSEICHRQDALWRTEEAILGPLFAALNSAGVHYAVMRNYASLPFSLEGSDLDLIVTIDDKEKARRITLETIRSAQGVCIGIAKSAGFFKIHAFGKSPEIAHPWWGVCLDFNCGLFFRGIQLINENAPWPLRIHNGIPVLSEGFSAVLGVLKEALNNEIVPTQYAGTAREAARDQWFEIEVLLAPMGSCALARLRTMLLEDYTTVKMRQECRGLWRDIKKNAFLRRGLRTYWDRMSYGLNKVRRYLFPSGLVIALLGVDGAGKTTLIDAILPTLASATHNTVIIKHLRPFLLPPLARLKGGGNVNSKPVEDPHKAEPSGMCGSILRACYLTADYLLGYWFQTRPAISKVPAVILFDRYSYDMQIDPLRFRIGLPRTILSWFSAMTPKPHIIICLHGNPELIAQRKGELTVMEIKRQMATLEEFAKREPRAVLVSTETSIEETRDNVLGNLFEFSQRNAERLV